VKTVFELLKNPFIKMIAVGVILYLGLFADKKNPDSLGVRLSKQNVAKEFQEAKKRTSFIVEKIRVAKEIPLNQDQQVVRQLPNVELIQAQNIKNGQGEEILKCGFEALISYTIALEGSKNNLEEIIGEKIVIGSQKNYLLEKKIIGMKKGGIRQILIPRHFESDDLKINALLKFNEMDLILNVTLLDFLPTNLTELRC